MTAMFIYILGLTWVWIWIWIFNSWMGCQHSWEAHISAIGLLEEPDRAKPPWDATSLSNPCKVGSRKLTLHSQIIFCSLKVLFRSCEAVKKKLHNGQPLRNNCPVLEFFLHSFNHTYFLLFHSWFLCAAASSPLDWTGGKRFYSVREWERGKKKKKETTLTLCIPALQSSNSQNTVFSLYVWPKRFLYRKSTHPFLDQ